MPGLGMDHGDGDPNPGEMGPLLSAQVPYEAVVSGSLPCVLSLCHCLRPSIRPLPVADRLSWCHDSGWAAGWLF